MAAIDGSYSSAAQPLPAQLSADDPEQAFGSKAWFWPALALGADAATVATSATLGMLAAAHVIDMTPEKRSAMAHEVGDRIHRALTPTPADLIEAC